MSSRSMLHAQANPAGPVNEAEVGSPNSSLVWELVSRTQLGAEPESVARARRDQFARLHGQPVGVVARSRPRRVPTADDVIRISPS